MRGRLYGYIPGKPPYGECPIVEFQQADGSLSRARIRFDRPQKGSPLPEISFQVLEDGGTWRAADAGEESLLLKLLRPW